MFIDYNKGIKYLEDHFSQVERTDLLNYQLKPAKWKAKIYPIITSWTKPTIRVDIFQFECFSTDFCVSTKVSKLQDKLLNACVLVCYCM